MKDSFLTEDGARSSAAQPPAELVDVDRSPALDRAGIEERLSGALTRIEALETCLVEVSKSILNIANGTLSLPRVQMLEARLAEVYGTFLTERGRLDWALGGIEGLIPKIEEYHAYRKSPEYSEVFAVSEPLVSVVVPTMNRSGLLVDRAIKSLQSQTYKNLQIVVVGDHCTDDTEGRINEIGDCRIEFVNLPARGPYPKPPEERWFVAGLYAENKALSLCKGHFITHLDDDDEMVPHRIETLVNAARSNRADFIWHSFLAEQKNGAWITLGDGRLELAQVTTGSVFYHRYFSRFQTDLYAYRLNEPGDWNRFRKIKMLRPRLHFINEPLLRHYVERSQPPFTAQDGEEFLE